MVSPLFMGKTQTKKPWVGVYIKVPKKAYKSLLALQEETGKTFTAIFVDYVTERRQFEPELEAYIERERVRRGLSSRRRTVSVLLSEIVPYIDQNHPKTS